MSTPNTHYGANRINELLSPDRCKRIFFCGVGGINMSSLASVTLEEGYLVSGSDRQKSRLTEELSRKGAEIFYEHNAKNLEGCDAFVYTVAISPDNPEYVRAGEMKIPRISRADYLGYIMTKYQNRIGICGTHGKSTTTAMCASIFEAARREPTVMCGAEFGKEQCAYMAGARRDFIFEACEYMDSFLDFNPNLAVVLNVELDHVDYFKSIGQMKESYRRFTDKCGADGTVVYNLDDKCAADSVGSFEGKLLSFGISDQSADVLAKNIEDDRGQYSFDLCYKGDKLIRISLRAIGKHNVLDGLAAATAALALGVSPEAIKEGLEGFCGTRRRMEYKGDYNGASVYDDYAHHPTEVRASLSSMKKYASGRLICLFQSHTYSRTHALLDDFADALRIADLALIAPIYSAREVNESGVSQYTLAEKIGNGALACRDFDECEQKLKEIIKNGDTVILMGAGDAPKILENFELVKKIKK